MKGGGLALNLFRSPLCKPYSAPSEQQSTYLIGVLED